MVLINAAVPLGAMYINEIVVRPSFRLMFVFWHRCGFGLIPTS